MNDLLEQLRQKLNTENLKIFFDLFNNKAYLKQNYLTDTRKIDELKFMF